MSKFNMENYCFHQDGVLDVDLALESFRADLIGFWNEKRKVEIETEQKIHQVFDQYPSARMNITFMVATVCRDVDPNLFSTMETKTKEVLHSMRDRGLISIERGKKDGSLKRIKSA